MKIYADKRNKNIKELNRFKRYTNPQVLKTYTDKRTALINELHNLHPR